MSGYYNFQKLQANEQIQTRMSEGEAHRMAKEANGSSPLSASLRLIVPAFIGLAIVFLLLSGCSPDLEPETDVEEAAGNSETMSMGDRLRFHDKLEASSYGENNPPTIGSYSMADWIQFQDRRDATLSWQNTPEVGNETTMKERIEFHDRILEQNR